MRVSKAYRLPTPDLQRLRRWFPIPAANASANPKTQMPKSGPPPEPTRGNGRIMFLLQNLTIVTRPDGGKKRDWPYGFLLRRD